MPGPNSLARPQSLRHDGQPSKRMPVGADRSAMAASSRDAPPWGLGRRPEAPRRAARNIQLRTEGPDNHGHPSASSRSRAFENSISSVEAQSLKRTIKPVQKREHFAEDRALKRKRISHDAVPLRAHAAGAPSQKPRHGQPEEADYGSGQPSRRPVGAPVSLRPASAERRPQASIKPVRDSSYAPRKVRRNAPVLGAPRRAGPGASRAPTSKGQALRPAQEVQRGTRSALVTASAPPPTVPLVVRKIPRGAPEWRGKPRNMLTVGDSLPPLRNPLLRDKLDARRPKRTRGHVSTRSVPSPAQDNFQSTRRVMLSDSMPSQSQISADAQAAEVDDDVEPENVESGTDDGKTPEADEDNRKLREHHDRSSSDKEERCNEDADYDVDPSEPESAADPASASSKVKLELKDGPKEKDRKRSTPNLEDGKHALQATTESLAGTDTQNVSRECSASTHSNHVVSASTHSKHEAPTSAHSNHVAAEGEAATTTGSVSAKQFRVSRTENSRLQPDPQVVEFGAKQLPVKTEQSDSKEKKKGESDVRAESTTGQCNGKSLPHSSGQAGGAPRDSDKNVIKQESKASSTLAPVKLEKADDRAVHESKSKAAEVQPAPQEIAQATPLKVCKDEGHRDECAPSIRAAGSAGSGRDRCTASLPQSDNHVPRGGAPRPSVSASSAEKTSIVPLQRSTDAPEKTSIVPLQRSTEAPEKTSIVPLQSSTEALTVVASTSAYTQSQQFVKVRLTLDGRDKYVKHAPTTTIENLLQQYQRQVRDPFVVKDDTGFEVGREVTLAQLGREKIHLYFERETSWGNLDA